MNQIRRAYSGSLWEEKVGYCRALRAGDWVLVTGTTAVAPDGGVFAPGDAHAQTRRCFDIIEQAVVELGANLGHVVRTRMFVTDISRWEEFGRAHQEIFGANPPCAAMVEVQRLIHPAMLIEIEADLWHPNPPAPLL